MTSTTVSHVDQGYEAFLGRIQARFVENTKGVALFTTGTSNLYSAFLAALPIEERQYHTCHACRRFVDTFGGLVTIKEDGGTQPAFWDDSDTPELYQASVRAILKTVSKAPVTGVFLSSLPVWGQPVTGTWRHLSVTPQTVFKRATQTAGQVMAEKHEDYGTLCRALADFTPEMLVQAVALLKSEALYRSEKVLGMAEWLLNLQQQRIAEKNNQRRSNLTWRAVATAPAGFCHPRSSMIGTLLEDIAAGLPFTEVSRKFAAKMHPLQYQRPQAAPSAGNIAQAEKVIGQLEAAGALARRFACLDDIVALWTPQMKREVPTEGGVFAHLLPKVQQHTAVIPPPIAITWEKFVRIVLSGAQEINLLTPSNGSYAALVTAADPAAPPIIQWDSEAQRNPVSWYLYNGGSRASDWGLVSGRYHKVTAITLSPAMWYGDFSHQGKGVLFVLEGARDSRSPYAGAGLFPEILKAEFHGIRSTIEAYSRRASIAGLEEGNANGLMLQSSSTSWNTVVRVISNGIPVDYKLDRWD